MLLFYYKFAYTVVLRVLISVFSQKACKYALTSIILTLISDRSRPVFFFYSLNLTTFKIALRYTACFIPNEGLLGTKDYSKSDLSELDFLFWKRQSER